MGKRRFRILDTNVLINGWHRLPHSKRTNSGVKLWARELAEIYDTDLIASPVRIEFLCGAKAHELELFRVYLSSFKVIDAGSIPRQDWEEAERIAKRVVNSGRHRKLGDCLLMAISLRLNCDIVSADRDITRRVPPRKTA
jgi:predicted nucleic acid-binding protein